MPAARQLLWQCMGREPTGLERFVPGLEIAADHMTAVDDDKAVAPRVVVEKVDLHQIVRPDEQPGLLPCLADGRLGRVLVDLDIASGQVPTAAKGIDGTAQKQQLALSLDERARAHLETLIVDGIAW